MGIGSCNARVQWLQGCCLCRQGPHGLGAEKKSPVSTRLYQPAHGYRRRLTCGLYIPRVFLC